MMRNNKYPIYIISKGRWETRFTAKTLDDLNMPYKIVIEPKEFKQYSRVINFDKILTLPDNYSELGQGGIPARNWVWEHAISTGAKRHWILDDNIRDFYRMNNNLKLRVGTNAIFLAMEDFVDRYENIAFAGPNYTYLLMENSERKPPFTLNTRVYSMILVKNDLPYRWRGRYNEDTDLCLRALKDGWCTVLFNAFLGGKITTMIMKGGNTDTIYNTGDKRLAFAESLKEQHPDVVRVVWKYDRWHHYINYDVFKKNKLKRIPNLNLTDQVNNYGMILKKI
jgi:hypothetical protein